MNKYEKAMVKLGWEFVPTGPNEWEWLKFDQHDNIIARQGDKEWGSDLNKCWVFVD